MPIPPRQPSILIKNA
ncbi:hypothetical protein YPPY103_0930, partial [Yersinia pestis PY-103]